MNQQRKEPAKRSDVIAVLQFIRFFPRYSIEILRSRLKSVSI